MSEDNNWFNTNIIKFKDQDGTIFTKGPFKVNGINYDYMLQESESDDDVDYCTASQMLFWKVDCIEVLEEN